MSTPPCPQCGKPLQRVYQESNSPFNEEQWHSMIAGDLCCEFCPDNGTAKNGKAYFWESELPKPSGQAHAEAVIRHIDMTGKVPPPEITDTQRLNFVEERRLDLVREHVLGQHFDWTVLTFDKDPYGFVRPRTLARNSDLRAAIDEVIVAHWER